MEKGVNSRRRIQETPQITKARARERREGVHVFEKKESLGKASRRNKKTLLSDNFEKA